MDQLDARGPLESRPAGGGRSRARRCNLDYQPASFAADPPGRKPDFAVDPQGNGRSRRGGKPRTGQSSPHPTPGQFYPSFSRWREAGPRRTIQEGGGFGLTGTFQLQGLWPWTGMTTTRLDQRAPWAVIDTPDRPGRPATIRARLEGGTFSNEKFKLEAQASSSMPALLLQRLARKERAIVVRA